MGAINVLFGPSGAGKSTLLDTVYFFRDCAIRGVEVASSERDHGIGLLWDGASDDRRILVELAGGGIPRKLFVYSDPSNRPAVAHPIRTAKADDGGNGQADTGQGRRTDRYPRAKVSVIYGGLRAAGGRPRIKPFGRSRCSVRPLPSGAGHHASRGHVGEGGGSLSAEHARSLLLCGRRAVNEVLGTDLEDFDGDVETIGHPKNELKSLHPPFDEKEHGRLIVSALDVPHVLSHEERCASLRTMFAWGSVAVGVTGWLPKGRLHDTTKGQIDALRESLR